MYEGKGLKPPLPPMLLFYSNYQLTAAPFKDGGEGSLHHVWTAPN